MVGKAHASWRALGAALLFGVLGATTLAQPPATPAPLTPERNLCADAMDPVAVGAVQWNGWGRDLDNTRYQPEPAIRASDVAKLGLKWAYGYQIGTPSAEFGQPTIVDGRLFITSSAGRVYALDAKTGCTYWTYDAQAGVRTAVSIGELGQSKRVVLPKKLKRTLAHLEIIKAPSAAFFGDDSGAVYALDAKRGTLLWKTQVDAHPLARIVGSPVLANDRLYVTVAATEDTVAAGNPSYGCCTFRGSVAALDIASGRIEWKTYTVLEEPRPTRRSAGGVQEFGPAGAAISSSPTIDIGRNVLYVATGNSTTSVEQSLTDAVAAFGLADGKLRWVKQLNRPDSVVLNGFSTAPVLRTLTSGTQIILAGQRSGVVYALNPDRGGEILWQTKVDPVGGTATDGAVAGGAAPGGIGPTGTAPGGIAPGGIAWGTAADHRNLYVAFSGSLSQPPNPSGAITALDLKTGAARWLTLAPMPACAWGEHNCVHGQAQAVTVMPGIALSGSLDGHLRAYSSIDGKIVWDVDTAKDFQTLNGVKASGGALDHGGPTVVNGIVYVNSGNTLLAFSVDGK